MVKKFIVEKFMVEKFMIEKFIVEKFMVEKFMVKISSVERFMGLERRKNGSRVSDLQVLSSHLTYTAM